MAFLLVQRFDLYLLSDRYVDGTAIELCQELRLFDRLMPILFYSAFAFESNLEKAREVDAQG